jgi:L-threonylcarbamoyladenylate synthase
MILSDNATNRNGVSKTISAGGLIAFLTDTFYGLGVDPLNPLAIKRLIDLKGREQKPILLLISDRAEVERFIKHQSEAFQLAAAKFWPGPLTIVGAANPNVSQELTAGTETIGLRLPDDEELRSLVRLCGGALTATSANLSGAPPAQTAEEVAAYFPTGVDVILNGGRCNATKPSTVLDASQAVPRIIREGEILREQLEEVIRVSTDSQIT